MDDEPEEITAPYSAAVAGFAAGRESVLAMLREPSAAVIQTVAESMADDDSPEVLLALVAEELADTAAGAPLDIVRDSRRRERERILAMLREPRRLLGLVSLDTREYQLLTTVATTIEAAANEPQKTYPVPSPKEAAHLDAMLDEYERKKSSK